MVENDSAGGPLQRWLILEPIPANGLTDNAVQAIVKIVAGVESERAVTYGSMMTSAVPAIGTLSVPAKRATPL